MAGTEVTFRDFAAAVMTGDAAEAARVLGALLDLAPGAAEGAVAHFERGRAAGGAAFMMKAMSLRQAVTGGDDAAIRALLADCFGLAGAELDGAAAAVRARYG